MTDPHYFFTGVTTDSILKPQLKQFHNCCFLSALVRQIDYQVRLDLIDAGIAKNDVFDHEAWGEYVTSTSKTVAAGKGLKIHEGFNIAMDVGISCYNGSKQKINSYSYVFKRQKGVDDETKFSSIANWINLNVPLIGVMVVLDNYPELAERAYTLLPELEKYDPCDTEIKPLTHAVVIIGCYPAGENDRFGIPQGNYIIYQESRGRFNDRSLLGNGIGIVHPRYLVEAIYAFCDIPNMLVTTEAMKKKSYRKQMQTFNKSLIRDMSTRLEEEKKRKSRIEASQVLLSKMQKRELWKRD